MTDYTREEVIQRLKNEIANGRPILAAGAGVGLSAKCAELGGADLIMVYNSGKFRMNGLPSMAGLLAFSDANQVVYELGEQSVLPVVKNTPVVAGVFGIDPTRDMRRFLKSLKALGYSGVINFPTVGRIDGNYRIDLNQVGFTFEKEVNMLQTANELDLFTMAYVWNEQDAKAVAAAGIDCVVAHMGVTRGGSVGVKQTISLQDAVKKTDGILNAALDKKADIIPLTHGGPVASPDDVRFVLKNSIAKGFVGASSLERLPVEQGIIGAAKEIKEIQL